MELGIECPENNETLRMHTWFKIYEKPAVAAHKHVIMSLNTDIKIYIQKGTNYELKMDFYGTTEAIVVDLA